MHDEHEGVCMYVYVCVCDERGGERGLMLPLLLHPSIFLPLPALAQFIICVCAGVWWSASRPEALGGAQRSNALPSPHSFLPSVCVCVGEWTASSNRQHQQSLPLKKCACVCVCLCLTLLHLVREMVG